MYRKVITYHYAYTYICTYDPLGIQIKQRPLKEILFTKKYTFLYRYKDRLV